MEVILAKSAGFCFGVNRAVELVERVAKNGKRVCTFEPFLPFARSSTIICSIKLMLFFSLFSVSFISAIVV